MDMSILKTLLRSASPVSMLYLLSEKLLCWEEILAYRQLCEGPWVTCRYFDTYRFMSKRKTSFIITNVMYDLSRWIEDMKHHEHHLIWGNFTRFRGINHPSAARLDMFLLFSEWENIQKYHIKDFA